MNATIQPINRQEMLAYLWVGTVVLWLAGMVSAAVWYALPRVPDPSRPIEVGLLADFPPSDTPYHLILAEGHSAWLVHTADALYIFDQRAPYRDPSRLMFRCIYPWNSATGRFEDPCTGDKWSLTGEVLEQHSPPHWNLGKLEPLTYEVTADGRLLVHSSQE
ncbi:MAG: hypothetical protein IPL28_04330 [Chloroflexi bacterium]|nr:hypothetical protein [Chloroflexota bacterium]